MPVYGTRLTLGLVKPKLKEHRILRESDLREVRVGDSVQLGPFRVESIAVCHSIPDAVALSIETPVGRVVYTSDFKLDPAPPDGYPTDNQGYRVEKFDKYEKIVRNHENITLTGVGIGSADDYDSTFISNLSPRRCGWASSPTGRSSTTS